MAEQYQTVEVPGVGDVDFPASMSNEQIAEAVKTHYVKTPNAVRAAPETFSAPWFREKLWQTVHGATELLPAAGATVGSIAGAAAGPAGTVGGAALGGAAGESARQLAARGLGYDAPETSGEAAKGIAVEGAVQGAIQGATEGIGRLAPPLRRAAISQYERALSPTTAKNKAIAEKVTPELIDRGVHGTLPEINQQAGAAAAAVKPALDAAYSATPVSATQGSGWQILQDLQNLKSKYIVQGKIANPQAVDAINGVQDIVQQYGPDISPDSLRKLKSIFDDPVASAGGYGGADLTTKYALNAQRAAANSIRQIMSSASPDVAALNKEISLWLDVQKVVKASALRKTGQEGGLVRTLGPLAVGTVAGSAPAIAHAAGVPAGSVGLEGAAITAMVAGLGYAMRTPAWRTASAIVKDRIADAVAKGDVKMTLGLLARIGVAAPAVVRDMSTADQTETPPR